MIRMLVNGLIALVAGAIGLLVAAAALDDFHVNASGFVVAVVVFAVLQAVLGPFVATTARRNVPALLGAVGLITTFAALAITVLVTEGLSIDGLTAWVVGTLIVWLVSLVAVLIVPLILVKLGLQAARDARESR